MPWLHTRFAIISAILGLILLMRLIGSAEGRSRLAAFMAVPVVGAVGWFAYFRIVYGEFDPSVPYGGDTQTSATNILTGVPALLFDHQFGILRTRQCTRFVWQGCSCWRGAAASRDRVDGSGSRVPRRGLGVPYVVGGLECARAISRADSALLAIPAHGYGPRPRVSLPCSRYSCAHREPFHDNDPGRRSARRAGYNIHDGYGRAAEWINPLVDVSLGMPSFLPADIR